jgi:hypothetical protein
MTQEQVRKLLDDVRRGRLSVDNAVRKLRFLPFEDLSVARVDSHRAVRCGFPEVIFCQGKRPQDITTIARTIIKRSDCLLATRADRAAFAAVRRASSKAVYHERARCVTVVRQAPPREEGRIVMVSAGTADIPVVEEARITAELLGHRVETVFDVGVAGLHRLLGEVERLAEADAIVVAAGMEGALASVVGGLVDVPVIAVPTSVGYGAHLGGLAPLLTMLNSCASGVAVVNIDNGFGAGFMAALIARRRARP